MCAGAGVVEGDLGDALDRRGGVDGAVGVQEATVSVVGVFAETNVAGNVQVREKFADFFDCKDDWAGLVVCGGPAVVLRWFTS